MSPFDLDESIRKARKRLGPVSSRRPRSDRGRSRLDPGVLDCVAAAVSGRERPPMGALLEDIAKRCGERRLRPPSRATIYKLLARLPGPRLRVGDLPPPVQAALYNLEPRSEVTAREVAFYCFNYGDLRAASFAAGLPWLALYQAVRMPGYRFRSRGLALAAAKARGI